MRCRPIFTFSAAAILATGAVVPDGNGQGLPKDSPFTRTEVAPAKPAGAAYELVGMAAVGNTTLLGISRVSDRHSFWIPLGGTSSELTAISYNAVTAEAVIRADGKILRLTMQPETIAAGGPTDFPAKTVSPVSTDLPPLPAATATATPPPMTAAEEKAMEARMLVTDLLEIGLRQRQAYAEAQKQAAARPRETDTGSSPRPPQ